MTTALRGPAWALAAAGLAALLAAAFELYRSPVMAILLDGFPLCG